MRFYYPFYLQGVRLLTFSNHLCKIKKPVKLITSFFVIMTTKSGPHVNRKNVFLCII